MASSTAYSDNGEILFQLSGQNRSQLPYLHSHLSRGHTEPLEIWKVFWVVNLASVFSVCEGDDFLFMAPCPMTSTTCELPSHALASPFEFQISLLSFALLHSCTFLGCIGDSGRQLCSPLYHQRCMHRGFWSYLLWLGFLQRLLWHKKT